MYKWKIVKAKKKKVKTKQSESQKKFPKLPLS